MKNNSFVVLRKVRSFHNQQHGATLIVGLIMLVLITLIVVNAFNLSSSNLKSVGNMQVRDEAVAAANQALETLLSTPTVFKVAPASYEYVVNINKDSTSPRNYTALIAPPTCIRATKASSEVPSDVEMGAAMSAGSTWNVNFDVAVNVVDSASGANVEVHQGVSVLLSQVEKNIACP